MPVVRQKLSSLRTSEVLIACGVVMIRAPSRVGVVEEGWEEGWEEGELGEGMARGEEELVELGVEQCCCSDSRSEMCSSEVPGGVSTSR